jgi:hypothetical protein
LCDEYSHYFGLLYAFDVPQEIEESYRRYEDHNHNESQHDPRSSRTVPQLKEGDEDCKDQEKFQHTEDNKGRANAFLAVSKTIYEWSILVLGFGVFDGRVNDLRSILEGTSA